MDALPPPPSATLGVARSAATAALPGVVANPTTQALGVFEPPAPRDVAPDPPVGGVTQAMGPIEADPRQESHATQGIASGATQVLGAITKASRPEGATPATKIIVAAGQTDDWENGAQKAAWKAALEDHSAEDAWAEALREGQRERSIWDQHDASESQASPEEAAVPETEGDDG